MLGDTVQTDALFSSSSLRTVEEVLFCRPGPKTSPADISTWEAYWEHNDPLRDVDEVAIPVLCMCSQDDPVRGDPESSLPLELFESNPHFFLLLTAQGGHCGFSTPREGASDRPDTVCMEPPFFLPPFLGPPTSVDIQIMNRIIELYT